MLTLGQVEHHLFQAGEDLRHRLNLIWDCIKVDPLMWNPYEVRIAWHAMSMSKEYFDAHVQLLGVLDELSHVSERNQAGEVGELLRRVEEKRLAVQKVLMRPPSKPNRRRRR